MILGLALIESLVIYALSFASKDSSGRAPSSSAPIHASGAS
jgi:hypothetical protein